MKSSLAFAIEVGSGFLIAGREEVGSCRQLRKASCSARGKLDMMTTLRKRNQHTDLPQFTVAHVKSAVTSRDSRSECPPRCCGSQKLTDCHREEFRMPL